VFNQPYNHGSSNSFWDYRFTWQNTVFLSYIWDILPSIKLVVIYISHSMTYKAIGAYEIFSRVEWESISHGRNQNEGSKAYISATATMMISILYWQSTRAFGSRWPLSVLHSMAMEDSWNRTFQTAGRIKELCSDPVHKQEPLSATTRPQSSLYPFTNHKPFESTVYARRLRPGSSPID
jgi:hypothetical protein